MRIIAFLIRYLIPLPVGYWISIAFASCVLYGLMRRSLQRKNTPRRAHAHLIFLLLYLGYLVSATVGVRESDEILGYELNPFWAYERVIGGEYFWPEIVGNILLGVPIGFLLFSVLKHLVANKSKAIMVTILLGMLFSSGIEISQLLLHKGRKGQTTRLSLNPFLVHT